MFIFYEICLCFQKSKVIVERNNRQNKRQRSSTQIAMWMNGLFIALPKISNTKI